MWSALCTVGFLPIVAMSLAGAVSLEQNPRELTVREGERVTFQCSMTRGDMREYSMSWYRQGPSGIQEWIYKNGAYGGGFQNRFKIKDESHRNRFPLQILLAKQEDAATYYCQAECLGYVWIWAGILPTETGPGTILTVQPKVTVEKSTKPEDGIGTTTPLPRIFSTKNISFESEFVHEQNTSVLPTVVTCTDEFHSSAVTILPDPEGEKVNMLSMAVLGLRVLLAKSIAFNTLMSIKLFLP